MEKSERIRSLDGVRGLACLLVLLHHYYTGVLRVPMPAAVENLEKILGIFLVSGVDLFLVLSGFLVGGIIIDKYHTEGFLKTFYIRRICRIFPIYFALMLSFAIVFFFFQGKYFFDEWLLLDPLPFWSYLTFLQSYVMGLENNSGSKWLAISWSVSVEEQFYLFLPALFFLLRGRKIIWVIISVLLIAPAIRTLLFSEVGFYAGYMFFPARLDSLMWGVLLAYAMRKPDWKAWCFKYRGLIYLAVSILLALLIAQQLQAVQLPKWYRHSAIAIIYTFFLWVVTQDIFPRWRRAMEIAPLTALGFISYSVYMFHQAVNGLMHGVIYNSAPYVDSMERALVTLASAVITLSLGALSYRYFETPIRRIGYKYKFTPNTSARFHKGYATPVHPRGVANPVQNL